MIETNTLLVYITILLGFVFIPGPATLLTLARTTASGTKAGIATSFGIAVGDAIHTVMAIIGISAILMTSALLFTLVKYLGAAYLVYLGIKAILSKAELNHSPSQTVKVQTTFKQALLTEVLNPKTALFFVSFLPQFVNPQTGSVSTQLAILGALFIIAGLISTITVALCAGWLSKRLRNNSAVMRWQGKAVGAIYCGLGIRLALQER